MGKNRALLIGAAFLVMAVGSAQAEPPALVTDKSVDPTVIYLPGTGSPDEATVTLTVTGVGEPQLQTFPIDVVLVMDRSSSMAGQPLNDAKVAAMYFCSLLDYNLDQSGLVSFDRIADLNQELTSNHYLTIVAINELTTGGNTAIGRGINVAQGELISNRHRPYAEPVMVLLSDGESNSGPDPVVAAESAKAQGTIIYAIGLGDNINEPVLRAIASDPDSEYYYYAPSSEDLDSIYQRVHEHLSNLAARAAFATEILATSINYVYGSFSIDPLSIYVVPQRTLLGDTAMWELGSLNIGDSWVVSFNITASDTGHLPVDDFPNAVVSYINYLGQSVSVPFPQRYIDVLRGTWVEEDRDRGGVGAALLQISPNPFSSFSTVHYSVIQPTWVTVEVYNLAGELVRTLVAESKPAGNHSVGWHARDNLGREVPSGVYLLRLKAGDATATQKMVLLR